MNSPWSTAPPLPCRPISICVRRARCRASAGCRYTSEQAGKSLFPSGESAAAALSSASGSEKALLAQTGGDKADTGIRDTVNHETSQKVAANDHLVRELLDWVHGAGEKPAATVDAAPKPRVSRKQRIKASRL